MPIEMGQKLSAQSGPGSSSDDARNRLEYLADHLLELQELAGKSGGSTLNGLLALAHSEARIQAEALARRTDAKDPIASSSTGCGDG